METAGILQEDLLTLRQHLAELYVLIMGNILGKINSSLPEGRPICLDKRMMMMMMMMMMIIIIIARLCLSYSQSLCKIPN